MKRILLLTLLLFLIGGTTDAYSQGFLKKLGKKAQEISKTVLGEDEKQKAKETFSLLNHPTSGQIVPNLSQLNTRRPHSGTPSRKSEKGLLLFFCPK